MLAATMPLFVFTEFADQSFAWMESHMLATLLVLAGVFALGMVGLVLHDTRFDDRSELDDTEPRIKVVQIKDGTPRYGAEEYRALVERYQTAAKDADGASSRVLDQRDAMRAEMAAKWAQRSKKERA
jgi:hypothetical protein